ncbi:MAG: hypothetical protein EOL97_12865 [Spirochaetia bacterium]|nr:hypothetical protein [Spirochaetia bacterium]
MTKIKSNGTYSITANNTIFEFEGGVHYEIEEDIAKSFIECGYCSCVELEKNDDKSSKTDKNKK